MYNAKKYRLLNALLSHMPLTHLGEYELIRLGGSHFPLWPNVAASRKELLQLLKPME